MQLMFVMLILLFHVVASVYANVVIVGVVDVNVVGVVIVAVHCVV